MKIAGRVRTLAASAIFILLTAAKLLSPAAAQSLRDEVINAVSHDDDYMAAVQAIGEKLNPESGKGATEVMTTGKVYTPVTIEELRKESTSILPSPRPSAESSQSQPTPAPSPVPSQVPKVVQTFLDSQKKYSDYDIPADVSYDMPKLPFDYAAPVSGYTSSGFGYRLHPILNEIKYHYGTDYAAQSGDDVYAFADGTVETAENSDSFGKYIIIDHADGYKTLYAHCSKLYVSAGSSVKKGQKIALVGATGNATGPHLHFELTSGNTYLNPEFYV